MTDPTAVAAAAAAESQEAAFKTGMGMGINERMQSERGTKEKFPSSAVAEGHVVLVVSQLEYAMQI